MSIKNILRNTLVYLILFALALFGAVFATSSSWFVFDVAALIALICVFSIFWPLRLLHLKLQPATYAADDAHGPTLQLFGFGWYAKLAGPSGVLRPYYGKLRTFQMAAPLPRGLYPGLRLPLVAQDLFGWTQKRAQLTVETPLVVDPRHEAKLSEQVAVNLQEMMSGPRNRGDEPSFDLREFRDYAQGDPVNQIDWKATARRDQVVVRENEPAPSPQWNAVLVASSGAYFEQMLGVFVTLTRQVVLWSEANMLTDKGLVQLPEGAQLASFKASPQIDLAALAATSGKHGLIVFTQRPLAYRQVKAVLPKRAVVVVQFGAQVSIQTERQPRVVIGGHHHE